MPHTCEDCGEEFQTLSKKRLHDCLGTLLLEDVSGTRNEWIQWECVACGRTNSVKTDNVVETAKEVETVKLVCAHPECGEERGLVEGNAEFAAVSREPWRRRNTSEDMPEEVEQGLEPGYDCPECDYASSGLTTGPHAFLDHLREEHGYSSTEAHQVLNG